MTESGPPNAWPRAKLGDICSIVIGRTPRRAEPRYWGGTHTWATISDMTASDGVVRQTRESLSDDGAALCGDRLLPTGTLMFSFKLSIGQIAFAGCDLYTNEAIAGIIPHGDQEVDLLYLRRALSVADYDELIGHAAKGRTLNRKTLALLEIPLPPLGEQRRIVARLEAQMATAERARAAAAAQLAAIEAMPQALLREIFPRSPAARLPSGWRWAKLGDVCDIIMGQSPPGSTYRKSPSADAMPFFQGKADFGDLHPMPRTWCNEPKKVAEPGDVLISVRAPVGPTNVADVECCIGRGLAAIRCGVNVVWPFLLLALRTLEPVLAASGTGSTFKAISGKQLRAFAIPLPPIDEQHRIVRRLDRQTVAVVEAREAAQRHVDAIDALPAAALRLAFTP